jgi:HD-GYP domain-containing protein (c-di-GMP phosphodiesterase class II)
MTSTAMAAESTLRLVVALGELVGAMSLASDLGTGMPLEHGLRTCLLATRLADAAGCDEHVRADAWMVALLHAVGCTSDAHEAAVLYGDDLAVRAAYAVIDPARPAELLGFLRTNAGAGRTGPTRAAAFLAALAAGSRRPRAAFAQHCEVAELIAGRLGVQDGAAHALAFVFERWDGKGLPAGAQGGSIPLAARLLHVARDADALCGHAGEDVAVAAVSERAGSAYDPDLAAALCTDGGRLLRELGEADLWAAVMAAGPGDQPLHGERLDLACAAVADFVDLKSPWTRGHSRGVAGLAEGAAWRLGTSPADVDAVRRAALLHDLGRVGVSNAIWDKPGPLDVAEWERVRLHPYFTERALARSPGLAALGELGGAHHERLDGSGYHRRLRADALPPGARLIAAADAYHAMTEDRPYRPGVAPDRAAAALRDEVRAGRQDPEAAEAVLAAAGHRAMPGRRAWPAGLTGREVEVLRALARGASNKEIAGELGLSPKTVGHHVAHVYAKAGVSTRAAATLFALEHDLLRR